MAGNSIRFHAMLDDKVSSNLAKIRDNFDRMGKGAASASLIGNVGAKALGVGLGILQGVASKAGDILGDANRAAIEEERSIQRLSTSLKANIPAWDGNTAAIERTLSARMALGFSDDEQRESLSKLVAATHDVNKALDIQAVAMDLARFKGISLADATDALTKVEAGSFRILKSLGISLREGATQQEALTAVRRIAMGQAEDFAEINEGRLLVSQVKVNEAFEKFGTASAPLMVAGAEAGAQALTDLVEGIGVVAEATGRLRSEGRDPIADFIWGTTKEQALQDAQKGFTSYEESVRSAQVSIASSSEKVEKSSLDMADGVALANAKVRIAWETTRTKVTADAESIIDKAFAPLAAADRLLATNAEVAAARRVLASATATKAEKADARSTILAAQQSQADYLMTLIANNDTTSDAYKAGLRSLRKSIDNSSGPAKVALQKVYDWIIKTQRAAERGINIPVSVGGGSGLSPGGKAKGGPVRADTIYKVGEKGPEWFVSDTDGTIYPNGMTPGRVSLGADSGGGAQPGGSLTINFNSLWPPTQQQAREVAEVLDRELFYRQKTSPR